MKNPDSKLFSSSIHDAVEDIETSESCIWRINYELSYPFSSLPEEIKGVFASPSSSGENLPEDLPNEDDDLVTEQSMVDVLSTNDAQDAINKVRDFILSIDELKNLPDIKVKIKGAKLLAEAEFV